MSYDTNYTIDAGPDVRDYDRIGFGGEFSTRLEYDSQGRTLYVGKTLPGKINEVSGSVWQLTYYTYATPTSPNIETVSFASGSNQRKYQWTLRASYPYS